MVVLRPFALTFRLDLCVARFDINGLLSFSGTIQIGTTATQCGMCATAHNEGPLPPKGDAMPIRWFS